MSVALALYVQAVLDQRGWSQRQAAQRCGLGHGTLRRILAGQPVRPATLAQLAQGLGESGELISRLHDAPADSWLWLGVRWLADQPADVQEAAVRFLMTPAEHYCPVQGGGPCACERM
ncbi:MAG: helix-turn-helix domain-containing protein [Chloroflexi bacterium]|nr:helix-turn-helix domain-containing protein [Chloroflexota bacterium]